MATKAEVRNFIKSNFRVEETDDIDFLKIVVDLDGGRSQLTFCSIGEKGLVINSVFATKDDLTAAQALKMGEDHVLGIKALPDYYVVSNFVPIADIDASEINTGILFCAIQADNMEQEVGGDRF
jgi:hypothetical protein